MNTYEKAFPSRKRWDAGTDGFDLENEGMTLTQYAAIHLKIPMSGDPELDKMIRESRRADLADQTLIRLVHDTIWGDDRERATKVANDIINALLAEWERGTRDEEGD
jgi:hypothetical protein